MRGLRGLIREIHRRSLWQVLGIYLVAAWGVLQAVDGITSAAGLPDWLPSLALVLLLLGLPIVLATAFVQEGLGTREVVPSPEDQPAARVSVSTHLFTWRRAIAVGVAAFALWGVVATALLLRGGSPTASTTSELPSIAVLPFENMAGGDNQYFTDGIHDDIITALTQTGGMKVISRTSVLEFADAAHRPSIPDIADLLGVETILEGSVQRDGDRVRVTAQLIDGRNEGHLWAQQYTRDIVDMFALQADLAREIASRLGATLAPGSAARLERVPTADPAAYDLLLKARALDRVADGLTILDLVDEAIARDSSFAEAWALRGDESTVAYTYGLERTPERAHAALESAERALELAPDLPEAHLALGMYYYQIEQDYSRALALVARASRLRPGWARPTQVEGWIARRDRQFDLALEKFRQAYELDPRNFDILDDLAQTLSYVREYEEADRWSRSALALDNADWDARQHRAHLLTLWHGDWSAYLDLPPGAVPSYGVVYAALLGGGATALRDYVLHPGPDEWFVDNQIEVTPVALIRAHYHAWSGESSARAAAAKAAAQLLEPRVVRDPDDSRPHASLALAYAYLGRADDARREADRAVDLAQHDAYRSTWAELQRMWVQATLHDPVGAADAFERNVTQPGLGWSVQGLLKSPFLDPVRDAPEFVDRVDRLRRGNR